MTDLISLCSRPNRGQTSIYDCLLQQPLWNASTGLLFLTADVLHLLFAFPECFRRIRTCQLWQSQPYSIALTCVSSHRQRSFVQWPVLQVLGCSQTERREVTEERGAHWNERTREDASFALVALSDCFIAQRITSRSIVNKMVTSVWLQRRWARNFEH